MIFLYMTVFKEENYLHYYQKVVIKHFPVFNFFWLDIEKATFSI